MYSDYYTCMHIYLLAYTHIHTYALEYTPLSNSFAVSAGYRNDENRKVASAAS